MKMYNVHCKLYIKKDGSDIMKKLIIVLLCLVFLETPCSAVEGVTDATAETVAQATTEVGILTTEKIEEAVTEKKKTEKKSVKSETKKETKQEVTSAPAEEDNSQPRLMVTGYSIENNYITPKESRELTVILKNTHKKKAVSNIKLSLTSESESVRPVGMGTEYVEKISPGKSYSWTVSIEALHNAEIGEHKLNIQTEYEDKNGGSYSAGDVVLVEVRQPAKLSYDGAKLPVKVVEEDTVTVTVNLMNTGKASLYNCNVDFNIEGLDAGGSAFAGEIPPQENKAAVGNLLVTGSPKEVSGEIVITYEDAFGKEYNITEDVKTVIAKKVIKAQTDKQEEKSNPLWWLFVLIGLAVGGSLGFFIPYGIRKRTERIEDEKML